MLRSYFEKLKIKVLQRYNNSVNENVKNVLDMISTIKADYVVFSGAILTIGFFNMFETIFNNLKKRDTKIIFYGCGGSNYSNLEVEYVRKKIEEIKPYALITRDSVAFRCYKDLAEHSFNGIDCAFFINDYFTPAKLEMPKYCVFTFDRQPEPEIEVKDRLIVRTHHSHYCDPPKSYFEKQNTLISNLPEDYLNLYANAEAVYSDRVHACVVALSYGTPCKLYHKTPRALLFDRIGASGIEKELTYPDTNRIEREKKKQIKFLSDVLEK